MMTRDAAVAYGNKIGCRYYVYNDAGGLLGGCKTLADAEEMKARWEVEYENDPLNKGTKVYIKDTEAETVTDMRYYKDIIKAAVAAESKVDKNWSWKVKGITKKVAKIGWGYLDYLGEEECFTIRLDETEGTYFVIVDLLQEDKEYFSVGPDRWDDAHSVEEAVTIAAHWLAREAREIF